MTTFEEPKNKRDLKKMHKALKRIDETEKELETLNLGLDTDFTAHHDVWNYESENGAWIKAMKKAGLSKKEIIDIINQRQKSSINNMSPYDTAVIWWDFKKKHKL